LRFIIHLILFLTYIAYVSGTIDARIIPKGRN
jgi:hypothetical protein